MSKFYEEFFKQKGSAHDQLVLKCVTAEGKKRILEALHFLERARNSLPEPPENVWICDCEKTEWCKSPSNWAWTKQPTCSRHYGSPCEHFDPRFEEKLGDPTKYDPKKKGRVPTGKVEKLNPIGEWTKVEPIISVDDPVVTYEAEVICKHGNFIVGYADLLFLVSTVVKRSLKLSEDWVWKDILTKKYGERMIVDAKPELTDFGAVLRQIKTYMNVLRVPRGVVVTYSDPPAELIELLKNEAVYVVKFPKGVKLEVCNGHCETAEETEIARSEKISEYAQDSLHPEKLNFAIGYHRMHYLKEKLGEEHVRGLV